MNTGRPLFSPTTLFAALLALLLSLWFGCGPEAPENTVTPPLPTIVAWYPATPLPTVPAPTAAPSAVPSVQASPAPSATPPATPSPVPSPTSAPSGQVIHNIYLTFYGFDDNDDGRGHYGNAVISDPVIHPIATEDLGTYTHPSTFATDYAVARPGQLIYVPRLLKYYIMEDTCAECTSDQHFGKTRIDLYIGGNSVLQGSSLQTCEETLTAEPYTDTVIFNPSPDWPVDTAPLYRDGVCFY